jgi:signal transduction histidine kinase
MAEVATSVLHNVGNVLNSINISVAVVTEKLKASKVNNVAQVGALLAAHAGDLAAFITSDPTGRELPAYMNRLAERLADERGLLLKETDSIGKNIGHIRDIVNMQQSYAKVFGVAEKIQPSDLVEDALRMNVGALVRHEVQVVRDFEPDLPEIVVEKHKVLQILVNLIRNAKYACDESGRADKLLTLRLSRNGDRVLLAVIDNGVGIPTDNLNRIFNHGFTTRKDGHGFGLHSASLAAAELGGSLSVRSNGPQTGAMFTLDLPIQPPKSNG